MSAVLVGALVGAGIGLANLVVLRLLADRVELPETKKLLNVVGLADLVIFPVAGALIGAYAWD